MINFVEVLKNIWGNSFVRNRYKTEAFLENYPHIFLDIEKNFAKPKCLANLI